MVFVFEKVSCEISKTKTIANYIVDFYCANAHLIVELDGGGHYNPENERKDLIRTSKLEEFGLKVIRFCNTDIDKNFYSVCSVIDNEVKLRTLPLSANADIPLKEGDEERSLL